MKVNHNHRPLPLSPAREMRGAGGGEEAAATIAGSGGGVIVAAELPLMLPDALRRRRRGVFGVGLFDLGGSKHVGLVLGETLPLLPGW